MVEMRFMHLMIWHNLVLPIMSSIGGNRNVEQQIPGVEKHVIVQPCCMHLMALVCAK